MLLQFVKEALPKSRNLPKNIYETNKMLKELGLSYNKIHAWAKDWMIYWQKTTTETSCSVGKPSVCKVIEHRSDDEGIYTVETDSVGKNKRILAKILGHFSLVP